MGDKLNLYGDETFSISIEDQKQTLKETDILDPGSARP